MTSFGIIYTNFPDFADGIAHVCMKYFFLWYYLSRQFFRDILYTNFLCFKSRPCGGSCVASTRGCGIARAYSLPPSGRRGGNRDDAARIRWRSVRWRSAATSATRRAPLALFLWCGLQMAHREPFGFWHLLATCTHAHPLIHSPPYTPCYVAFTPPGLNEHIDRCCPSHAFSSTISVV